MCCFAEKSCVKEAVANVLKESYQQEMRDCASKDVIVPFFIYRKHKKGAMEEAAKLTVGQYTAKYVQTST